jgi:hypothetical protein
MTVRHPTLPEPFRLSWPSLRACAVEPPAVKRRWRSLEYDLFPIERSPGTVHPLDEPRWFLSTHDHGLDKRPVPLTTIDLSGRIPNVALLFRERLSVSIAAPPMPTGFGLISPAAALGAARSFAALTLPLARELRTISTPGLYLRVQDHTRLANALNDAGVRRAFTCEDWSFATGSPHRSQAPGRAPTTSA